MNIEQLTAEEKAILQKSIDKVQAHRKALCEAAAESAKNKNQHWVQLDTIRHDGKAVLAMCKCVDTGKLIERKSSDWWQCSRSPEAKAIHDKAVAKAAREFVKKHMNDITVG